MPGSQSNIIKPTRIGPYLSLAAGLGKDAISMSVVLGRTDTAGERRRRKKFPSVTVNESNPPRIETAGEKSPPVTSTSVTAATSQFPFSQDLPLKATVPAERKSTPVPFGRTNPRSRRRNRCQVCVRAADLESTSVRETTRATSRSGPSVSSCIPIAGTPDTSILNNPFWLRIVPKFK